MNPKRCAPAPKALRWVEEGPLTWGEMETVSLWGTKCRALTAAGGCLAEFIASSVYRRSASREDSLPIAAACLRAANSNRVRVTCADRALSGIGHLGRLCVRVSFVQTNRRSNQRLEQQHSSCRENTGSMHALTIRRSSPLRLLLRFAFPAPPRTNKSVRSRLLGARTGHAPIPAERIKRKWAHPGPEKRLARAGLGCLPEPCSAPAAGATNACQLDRSATTANLIDLSACVKL